MGANPSIRFVDNFYSGCITDVLGKDMREIKFRAWNKKDKSMHFDVQGGYGFDELIDSDIHELMQYIGLKDKDGDKEIYECDIIDTDGSVIGNQYETPALLEDKANLLIQGFGSGTWLTTYKEAVERGCKDA